MYLFSQFIYSFLSTVGFSILFNVPKSSIVYAGITGGIGWTLYIYINNLVFSVTFSSFIASIVVAILGEVFARIDKKPVTAFVIPGIVPLVPGYGMYLTMINLINDSFDTAIKIGVNAIFTGGAIAIGIILVSSVAKIIKSMKNPLFK
ncbi:Uncharacterized membrane protein YjjB, DUF3815 family [Alkalithermobacter thermoalcaliphilus JW-YL-7 = DSM 7308]|uniref:Uncharacterized membrane protein YjjB, DUF3815 family n=1 Tax=Alkalithermobacter thermoalcaliphilus JW-YL-7 = DSM 7308 TaxID=1121328 RepID=A0A150FP82_CLOPD|nr:protein of unknown function DUF3815 [[Clostridium] paradoxum JW-YL-7 = DSM 7308]SHK51562.1 Uncharacterized membrane protein YjjB, DUF3815 family [[Clostridium] paradoxum JW-YL-7 = DSM 7308]